MDSEYGGSAISVDVRTLYDIFGAFAAGSQYLDMFKGWGKKAEDGPLITIPLTTQ